MRISRPLCAFECYARAATLILHLSEFSGGSPPPTHTTHKEDDLHHNNHPKSDIITTLLPPWHSTLLYDD